MKVAYRIKMDVYKCLMSTCDDDIDVVLYAEPQRHDAWTSS
jgi:hypothetical protein